MTAAEKPKPAIIAMIRPQISGAATLCKLSPAELAPGTGLRYAQMRVRLILI
jgi:hypothetical protein